MKNSGSNSYFKNLLPVITLLLMTRVPCFTLMHPQWSDIPIYWHYAENTLNCQTPYKDFEVEYPPLALGLFVLPGLIARNLAEYQQIYRIWMMLFDLGCLILIGLMARSIYGLGRRKVLIMQICYILSTGVLFQILYDRFDIAVAFLILLAIYLALVRQSWRFSYLVLSIAFLTKLFPLLLILPLVMYQARRRNSWKPPLIDLSMAAGITLIALVVLQIWMGNWWQGILSYHGHRGIQVESLYASIVLLAYIMGIDATISHEYGAFQIDNAFTSSLSNIVPILMVVSIVAVYVIIWRAWKRDENERMPGSIFIAGTMVLLLIFVMLNKVLSPQFLLWLIPIGILAINDCRERIFMAGLGCLVVACTAWLFPYQYISLLQMQPAGIVLVIIRNMTLATLTFFAIRKLVSWRKSAAAN